LSKGASREEATRPLLKECASKVGYIPKIASTLISPAGSSSKASFSWSVRSF